MSTAALEQRMSALASANDKRIQMGRDRREIAKLDWLDAREAVAATLEAGEDCPLYGMPIARLLTSIKGVGTQKAERICVYARVSGHRRVRELTERQRNVIARLLRERRLS